MARADGRTHRRVRDEPARARWSPTKEESRPRLRGRRGHGRHLRDRLPARTRRASGPLGSRPRPLRRGQRGGLRDLASSRAGISPGEMYDEVTSHGRSPFGVTAAPLFRLGGARVPEAVGTGSARALTGPRPRSPSEGRQPHRRGLVALRAAASRASSTTRASRSTCHGLLRDPRAAATASTTSARPLFVVAVDLDRGEAVAFGDASHRDVPVSRAVQASTALPGLYRPVRIDGRDYVDGGVKKTAHINLAIQNGAGLVICINPLVPIHEPDAGRTAPGPPEQPRARPTSSTRCCGSSSTAAWSTGSSATGRAPRGGHPAPRAPARRPADVQLQHHALRRAAGSWPSTATARCFASSGRTRGSTGGC